MNLTDIYAPVQNELKRVETTLKSIGEVDFPHLAELITYSLTNNGKMLRPVLTFLSGKTFRYDENLDTIVNMASAIEIMHIATLVHDDAIDHSDTRRGKTTVYRKWGLEQAVLLGDYLFAVAGRLTADTGVLRVISKFSETLQTISHGEINQAYSSFRLTQEKESYYSRIAKKTSALFSLSTVSGSVLAKAPDDAVRALDDYAYHMGIGFQIVDDIFDFAGTEEQLGKPVGSDLSQGTLTLPSFMLLERYPDDNPVKTVFEKQGKNVQPEISRAIDMVKNSSIIEDCYTVARKYCEKAKEVLRIIPEGDGRQCLENLTEYIMLRDK